MWGGALIGVGVLIETTSLVQSVRSALYRGGASLKEGSKLNHYDTPCKALALAIPCEESEALEPRLAHSCRSLSRFL